MHRLPFPRRAGLCAAGLLLAALAASPSYALLRFNEGRDQVHLAAYAGTGYDSNIFSRASGDNADFSLTGGASLEYARKAGLITVDGLLGWDFARFDTFSAEDYLNPRASLEFTKATGRTTGSLLLSTRRDSRADPTVGLRTESWNHGVKLDYRYPVIERYAFSGTFAWDRADYRDPGVIFSDLDTYTVGTDLLYRVRSDRDLLSGYRLRFSDSQASSQSTDHTVYLGLAGRVYSKLSGSARLGWTRRLTSYPGDLDRDSQDGLYASVATTWPATSKASLTFSATQDFNTTSTNFQTRSTSVDILGRIAHTDKFSTRANLGAGLTDYLNGYGQNAPSVTPGFNGLDRADHTLTAGLGADYTLHPRLTLSATYACQLNSSTLSDFDFTRHSVDLSLSTRW